MTNAVNLALPSAPVARGAKCNGLMERAGVMGFCAVVILGLLLIGIPAMAKEKAEDNYKTYCWQCHGSSGNGMGINVRDMTVQPRDHTDPKAMSALSDADIFKAVKEGGQAVNKSILMPPWGDTLTDDEIRDLAQYLRTLCRCQYGTTAK